MTLHRVFAAAHRKFDGAVETVLNPIIGLFQ